MAARRALVLAGGGARASFQAGVARNLIEDRGLDFPIIFGVSGGALNAAVLAQADARDNSQQNLAAASVLLRSFWGEIHKPSDVYEKRFGGLLGSILLGKTSIYDNTNGIELIRRHLNIGSLKSSGRVFGCGYVSLLDGAYVEVRVNHPDLFQAIVASTSIPVVFPPVHIANPAGDGDGAFVDGGVRNITPLGSVFDEKPDEIYVVLTSRLLRDPTDQFGLPKTGVVPKKAAEVDSLIEILGRAVDILTDEIYLSDLREALFWNQTLDAMKAGGAQVQISAQMSRLLGQRHRAKIHVIAPQEWFGEPPDLNDALAFEPRYIAKFIEHGRTVASNTNSWLILNG